MYEVDSSVCAQNQANARSRSYWTSAIRDSWQKSAAGIFETGSLLLQARDELDRDVFSAMKLPFGIRTRQMLMRVAAHPVLANRGSQLPPCWRTLYELTKLPHDILLARLEDGTINPGMERRDATALLNRPKKKIPEPRPDLLTAWAAATPEVRRVLFDRIGAEQLLGLISPAVRAKLIELLERHQTTAGSSSSLAVNLSRLLKVALSSTHANERENALAGINRKLKASGRDLHDVVIAMAGNKAQRKRAA